VANLQQIREFELDYKSMFWEQPFCTEPEKKRLTSGYVSALTYSKSKKEDEVIIISGESLAQLERVSIKYGIVALPWWLVMNDKEFEKVVERQTNKKSESGGGYSWWMSSTVKDVDEEKIPLIVTTRAVSRVSSSYFWRKVTTMESRPIAYCKRVVSPTSSWSYT